MARFLAEGWAAGDSLLVVAKPTHLILIADYLRIKGCQIEPQGDDERRAFFIDATSVLRRLRRRGVFLPDAATQVITELLDQAARPGRELRVYGEIVELLAEEGNFDAACQLEDAWNDVLSFRPLRLLCGYSAAHFADPRQRQALRDVCRRHTRAETHSADTLGTWLMSANRTR